MLVIIRGSFFEATRDDVPFFPRNSNTEHNRLTDARSGTWDIGLVERGDFKNRYYRRSRAFVSSVYSTNKGILLGLESNLNYFCVIQEVKERT